MGDDVVVLAALAWEARAVLDALQGVEPIGERSWRGYLGDGGAVRVGQIGVGQDRAARAAAEAVPARLYVSCGCAGGLVPGLRAGDIIIGDRVIALDGAGRQTDQLPVDPVGLAVWSGGRSIPVRIGAVASSPMVLSSAAGKAAAGHCGALVVEMESAAVARVARDRGAACAIVKVVLDEAADPIGFPGADAVDAETGEIEVGRALAALAVRPRVWPRAFRLARQQRIAERQLRAYLAMVCSAGLDALGLGPRSHGDASREVHG